MIRPARGLFIYGKVFIGTCVVIYRYIQKYNDPPVKNWLSVHGTVVGVTGACV